MQKVSFTTEDGVNISALFWDRGAFKSVLLLHMMPAQKESWVPLADRLAEVGLNVLAIDMRGHGESGGGNYKEFTPDQHYGYFKDQEAAVKYLQEKFPHTEIYMCGASIGANMSIKWMAEHPDVAKVVALSAGLDYYGVRAIDDVQKLSAEQHILLVGAHDDSGRGEMVEQLYDKATGVKQKIVFETGGHGTDMWNEHSSLIGDIVKFFAE